MTKFKVGTKVRVREDIGSLTLTRHGVYILDEMKEKAGLTFIVEIANKEDGFTSTGDRYKLIGTNCYWDETLLKEVEEEPIEEPIEKELSIGDEVYIVKERVLEKECATCKGTKYASVHINDQEFVIICPQCKGKGSHKGDTKMEYLKGVIECIRTRETRDSIVRNYTIVVSGKEYQRKIDGIFTSKKVVREHCLLNGAYEEVTMKLKDIRKKNMTPPRIEKMIDRMNYYKETKTFKKQIIVNQKNEIVDGFITYLIANNFGLQEIVVKRML